MTTVQPVVKIRQGRRRSISEKEDTPIGRMLCEGYPLIATVGSDRLIGLHLGCFDRQGAVEMPFLFLLRDLLSQVIERLRSIVRKLRMEVLRYENISYQQISGIEYRTFDKTTVTSILVDTGTMATVRNVVKNPQVKIPGVNLLY